MSPSSPSNTRLVGLNVLDHVFAGALMALTPEYYGLRRLRAAQGYDRSKPTYPTPNDMPFEMAEVDGEQIRIARHPNQGKPKVMLLTPLPQSILAYAPIWPILSERFELFAYDLPGFGRSTGGAQYMTFAAQGKFLKKVVDQFGLENIHIVAPDIGMPSALFYTGSFDNTVESLIIGDGPAIVPSTNASIIRKLGFSKFWALIIGNVGSGALIKAGYQIGYTRYVPNAEETADYKASYRGRMKTVLEWFRLYPESLASVDPLLEKIDTPTLLFWGEQDQVLPVDNGERLAKRMPNSRLHVLPGAGHFSYQDASQDFAQLIIDWIANGTSTQSK